MVAHKLAQMIVEGGLLPEGSFQFLAGSAGDLLDQLGPQDLIAFTGSADTGAMIRGHQRVLAHALHGLQVEGRLRRGAGGAG